MTEIGNQENVSLIESDKPKTTIEFLADYTAVQGEGKPVYVVNPAAGNEPIILGVKMAESVNEIRQKNGLDKAKIVVPIINDRQRKILIEESTDPQLVHIDTEFGEILRDTLSSQGNFPEHLARLKTHYDDVDQLVQQHFRGNFDTHSLTGEAVTHNARNIIGSMDITGRHLVSAPQRYFAFPVLISELLNAANQEGMPFSESDMRAVTHKMHEIEKAYTKVFIPKVNTLSYQYLSGDPSKSMDERYKELDSQPVEISGRSRIYTPAMKPELEVTHNEGVDEPGVYAMFSGHAATEQTRALIKAAQDAGLTVYTNPWADKIDGAHNVSPEALRDPKVKAIFGRSGWGTGWQAQNLAKPWFVDPYQEGDDPEIAFNNRVVEKLRMGTVADLSQLSPERLADDIQAMSPGLHRLNKKIRDEFGTTNGIEFMAQSIAEDYLQGRVSK